MKRDIRLIKWIDSSVCHAQVAADEYPTPQTIISVGVCVVDTKDYVTLALDSEMSFGRCRNLISIPRSAVLKEKRLK